jgi:hypothetical protein
VLPEHVQDSAHAGRTGLQAHNAADARSRASWAPRTGSILTAESIRRRARIEFGQLVMLRRHPAVSRKQEEKRGAIAFEYCAFRK